MGRKKEINMADKLKENIAKAMKNYRENTGMTQQELADELGIARGTLRKVESGEGDINLTSMITFAHMARIDLNSLLESEKRKICYCRYKCIITTS